VSSAPKRGLGRGLGALLGDTPVPTGPAAPATPGGEVVRQIPVDRIRPNPNQPRKTFDPQTLEELKASIVEHGVLVPILVRELPNGYELIAGERRWRASAAAQRTNIPAIVRPSTDLESLEVAIIENLQREDLNPLEEAAGMEQLIEAHDFTQEQVAQRLGKSRPAVTNALRLLTLPEAIKALIAEGSLTAGHARTLLAAPEGARLELAQRVVRDGLSVRALERIIAALLAPPPEKGASASVGRALSPEDIEFESRVRVKFGAPVALRRGGKGGSIEIKFTSEADLIRIAEILLEE
jgi:ParB family transcriptional regulator, chromosome partitioning protein